MAKDTAINWTNSTFNPWVGCSKISPACANCYAEGWAKRSGMVKWGVHEPRVRTSPANWKQPIKWNEEAKRTGTRRRVFCASLADVFDNAVPEEWRVDLFALIAATPYLDWLLLTKRIGNVEKMLLHAIGGSFYPHHENVWLGITVCNQEEANRDIPKLLKIPATNVFLSIEPMLGEIDLGFCDISWIDWVICGGESGSKARPLNPAWVRYLRDQCAAADVPFFFKQWGEFAPIEGVMQRVGKKKAGRLLDGREWNETPN